jgi:phosphoketolase
MKTRTLTPDLLQKMDAYWRAANYLSVGQIYLYDNPLPKRPPKLGGPTSTFAFHAYPWLIHRLTYRRTNHDNIHVRGYKEEGTISTPFDMTVLNDLDRFQYVDEHGEDLPEIRNWRFSAGSPMPSREQP